MGKDSEIEAENETKQLLGDDEITYSNETKYLTPKSIQELPPKKPSHGTYGSFVAYCFCVNYILGVGVLGIPHGFYAGGVLVGPILLAVVTVMAGLVVVWILETMARAQAFKNADIADEREQEHEYVDEMDVNERHNQKSRFFIGTHKFEINELCGMFMGRYGRIIYEISMTLYMYGGLWSYASVFAQSMASHVPFPFPRKGWFTCDVYTDGSSTCTYLYLIYIALFALIVVPLTCLDLTEQKPVQVLLTLFRYLALALMIIVIFVAIFSDPYSRFIENPHKSMERKGPYLSPFSWIRPAGFYQLMPVCIFSQILHHSTPGLSQPVRNKKHLPYIFTATFITTFSFYALLGVILAMYYGNNIQPTASLNFSYYRGGVPFGWRVPMWATAIILIVVLFPAIDVLSAFPLNGITLGNNIHAAFFSNNPARMSNRKISIVFRLAAAIPPVIGACIVRDLDVILSYVGLLGFVITFVFPPLLNMISKRRALKRFGSNKTPYTNSEPRLLQRCCHFVWNWISDRLSHSEHHIHDHR